MTAPENGAIPRGKSVTISRAATGARMILSFLLARLRRAPRFPWLPCLDLSDRAVYSTLIPGTQY